MERQPAVIHAPQALFKLKRGLDQLADLLAVTLGPSQGVVMNSTEFKPRPEVLTDAATIARRVLELPDAEENMGAMLLRNLVWRMKQRTGDGSATAAVLAQAILDRAQRALAAGANPAGVMHGIRVAAGAAAGCLTEMSRPVQGEDDLAAVARAVTGDEELSWILGEMFDILGPQAYITIEDYVAPYLEREYLDGGRWQGELISPYLITSAALGRAIQSGARVALYDGVLSQDDEVRPLLELAAGLPGGLPGGEQGPAPLLLVAQRIHGDALNLLSGTHQQTKLKVVAVNLKRAGQKAADDLQDLAWLSGATVITPAQGRRMQNIRPEDLGRAQRVEAGREDLLLAGGAGDGAEVRRQIELLNSQIAALPFGDEGRDELHMRLGRLAGSAGVLKVGAISQAERDFRRQKAEQGVLALRITLEDGLLPGGGTAYLHCLGAVQAALVGLDEEATAGGRAVLHALEAPFRRILFNAGIQTPGVPLAHILSQPPGSFYDVQRRQIGLAREAGVLDATAVLRAALETAASGAMMALSTATLVVKRKPKVSYVP